jgi:uroporphyrinogen-III synthase
MRLLVTRPEPDATRQAAKLAGMGHDALVSPLLAIEETSAAIGLDGIAATIATSQNALRAVSRRAETSRLIDLPVYTVGAATARLARSLGFAQVVEGAGTGEALAALIVDSRLPGDGALLHLRGEEVSFDMVAALTNSGYESRGHVVYRAREAKRFSAEAEAALVAGAIDGVLLMSPRTARVYARLSRQAGAAVSGVACCCLSPAVAAELDPAAQVRVASEPREDALLRLLDNPEKL